MGGPWRERQKRRAKVAPTPAPARLIVVFAEGEKTEHQYLTWWHRQYRRDVRVEFDTLGPSPKTLVDKAVRRKKAEQKDASKLAQPPEYWCVFDVDQHPGLAEAKQLAAAHGIRLAISNPCIEVWFILHFEHCAAYLERGKAQSESKRLLGCEKSLDEKALRALQEKYDDARKRCQELAVTHEKNGSEVGSNPSSNVWELIDSICGDI